MLSRSFCVPARNWSLITEASSFTRLEMTLSTIMTQIRRPVRAWDLECWRCSIRIFFALAVKMPRLVVTGHAPTSSYKCYCLCCIYGSRTRETFGMPLFNLRLYKVKSRVEQDLRRSMTRVLPTIMDIGRTGPFQVMRSDMVTWHKTCSRKRHCTRIQSMYHMIYI